MNSGQISSGLSDVLSLFLIIRLVTIRLHAAYRIFSAFLLFEVISQSFVFIERFTSLNHVLDYRITWLIIQIISWTLSIWMVYALLRAILEKLPGIVRFSRRVLKIALPIALLVALVSAGPEYLASGASAVHDSLDYAVRVALILSRMVATVALLVLLLTLFVIFWFPISMPRNLAVFSIGFGVYFSAKTFLLLFQSFWSHEHQKMISNGVTFILCTCLIYWIAFLNRKGEFASVTLGHSWGRDKQTSLVKDLEHLNVVLGRASRR